MGTLATGANAVVDEILSYQKVNLLKNHFYAAAGPADATAGVIWMDSDDGVVYKRYAAAWDVVGLDLLDEDDMASDDATKPSSQQALKAFVEARASRMFAGSFTYDLTTASGNQAIAGVGFQADRVEVLYHIIGSADVSGIGWDIGTSQGTFYNDNVNTAHRQQWLTTHSIYATNAAAQAQAGQISILGADGFTYTWTKTNNPVGTLTVYFKAYKD